MPLSMHLIPRLCRLSALGRCVIRALRHFKLFYALPSPGCGAALFNALKDIHRQLSLQALPWAEMQPLWRHQPANVNFCWEDNLDGLICCLDTIIQHWSNLLCTCTNAYVHRCTHAQMHTRTHAHMQRCIRAQKQQRGFTAVPVPGCADPQEPPRFPPSPDRHALLGNRDPIWCLDWVEQRRCVLAMCPKSRMAWLGIHLHRSHAILHSERHNTCMAFCSEPADTFWPWSQSGSG